MPRFNVPLVVNSSIDQEPSTLAPKKQQARDQSIKSLDFYRSVKGKMWRTGKVTIVVCDAGNGELGEALKTALQVLFGSDVTVFTGKCGFKKGIPVPVGEQ